MLLNFKGGRKINFVSGVKFSVKAVILLDDLLFIITVCKSTLLIFLVELSVLKCTKYVNTECLAVSNY